MTDMQPRVYLAGPWDDRAKMPAIAQAFKEAGFIITHDWWLHEADKATATDAFHEECARRDYEGVADADYLIVLNSIYSEGKAVEQGLALAWHTPICIIGRNKFNVFQSLKQVTMVDTVEDAISWALERERNEPAPTYGMIGEY